MARTVKLSEFRTKIRNLSEVREVYVGDAELDSMINDSIADLYSMLVEANVDRYVMSDSVSVVTGTALYALPADHYKTVDLYYVESANRKYRLRRFTRGELNEKWVYNYTVVTPVYTKYRDEGQNLRFLPTPEWTGTVEHWYVPVPTELSGDDDTFDGIIGWEKWVVYDVTEQIYVKEESDTSQVVDLKQRLEKRIAEQAVSRDEGEADKVRDVWLERYDWPGRVD